MNQVGNNNVRPNGGSNSLNLSKIRAKLNTNGINLTAQQQQHLQEATSRYPYPGGGGAAATGAASTTSHQAIGNDSGTQNFQRHFQTNDQNRQINR